MISESFLNTIECDDLGKGEGKWGKKKDNLIFELFHIFEQKSFLKKF